MSLRDGLLLSRDQSTNATQAVILDTKLQWASCEFTACCVYVDLYKENKNNIMFMNIW